MMLFIALKIINRSLITELHELGLFSVEEIKEAFKCVELSVRYDKDGLTGRGLYIAGRGKT